MRHRTALHAVFACTFEQLRDELVARQVAQVPVPGCTWRASSHTRHQVATVGRDWQVDEARVGEGTERIASLMGKGNTVASAQPSATAKE